MARLCLDVRLYDGELRDGHPLHSRLLCDAWRRVARWLARYGLYSVEYACLVGLLGRCSVVVVCAYAHHQPLPQPIPPSSYAYYQPRSGYYHRTPWSHNHTFDSSIIYPKWHNQLRRLSLRSTDSPRAVRAHLPRALLNDSAIFSSTQVLCIAL